MYFNVVDNLFFCPPVLISDVHFARVTEIRTIDDISLPLFVTLLIRC